MCQILGSSSIQAKTADLAAERTRRRDALRDPVLEEPEH